MNFAGANELHANCAVLGVGADGGCATATGLFGMTNLSGALALGVSGAACTFSEPAEGSVPADRQRLASRDGLSFAACARRAPVSAIAMATYAETRTGGLNFDWRAFAGTSTSSSARLHPGKLDSSPGSAEGDEIHRYYDPSIGRYLQPEPLMQFPKGLRAFAKRGIQLNPYAYAANNPLHYVDRDGRVIVLADDDARNFQTKVSGDPLGNALLDYLQASPIVYTIFGNSIPLPGEDELGITGKRVCGGRPDPTGLDIHLFKKNDADWDVLLHELGHAALYDYALLHRYGLPLELNPGWSIPGWPQAMNREGHERWYWASGRER